MNWRLKSINFMNTVLFYWQIIWIENNNNNNLLSISSCKLRPIRENETTAICVYINKMKTTFLFRYNWQFLDVCIFMFCPSCLKAYYKSISKVVFIVQTTTSVRFLKNRLDFYYLHRRKYPRWISHSRSLLGPANTRTFKWLYKLIFIKGD